MNNVTIVIQGPATNYTLETAVKYLKLDFVETIIISCWDTDKYEDIVNDKIRIIRNKAGSIYSGPLNINLQIHTSYAGIRESATKFSVKMRSDQRYSLENMIIMYNFYMNNKTINMNYISNNERPYNKIGVCGIFDALPFHPADHTFWGNTSDLLDFFNVEYTNAPIINDFNINVRPETYLGVKYCSRFDSKIEDYITNYNEYLTDNAVLRNTAIETSKNIVDKVFLRFMRLPFEWHKHYGNDTEGHNNAVYNTFKSIWADEDNNNLNNKECIMRVLPFRFKR